MTLFPHERCLFFNPEFWRELVAFLKVNPGQCINLAGHDQFGRPVQEPIFPAAFPRFRL